MRLDSTGELVGESRGFALSDQLFLYRHFVQNAQGFLESRFQVLDLRLPAQQPANIAPREAGPPGRSRFD